MQARSTRPFERVYAAVFIDAERCAVDVLRPVRRRRSASQDGMLGDRRVGPT